MRALVSLSGSDLTSPGQFFPDLPLILYLANLLCEGMAQEKIKRKLATIFSADVAGYSRLMGKDESVMVRTLEVYKNGMLE
jgi:class 3 adenylate cyclase